MWEAGLPWERQGMIGIEANRLIGKLPHRTILVSTTEQPLKDGYVVSYNPHLTLSLMKEVGIYTGKVRTLREIKNVIEKNREVQLKRSCEQFWQTGRSI